MPRRARVDWDAVSAAAPHGLILVRHLLALGVSSSTVAFRCRNAGSSWWRPLPGLVALARGVLSDHQRLVAALLYGGDDAQVTGVAACRLFGLKYLPDDESVHLLIPHSTRRRSVGFVRTERTKRMPAPRIRNGIACAPVPRAVVDAARTLDRDNDVRALLCESVQRRMTTVADLRVEVDGCSCRGAGRVRSAVGELETGVRSAPEAELRDLVLSMAGFPEVLWNASVHRADGRFLASPDAYVDSLALAIEVNSFAHHADPAAFDATMRRQAEMVAAGIVVVPVTPRELRGDAEGVKRKLWAALEQARSRPRPPLVIT